MSNFFGDTEREPKVVVRMQPTVQVRAGMGSRDLEESYPYGVWVAAAVFRDAKTNAIVDHIRVARWELEMADKALARQVKQTMAIYNPPEPTKHSAGTKADEQAIKRGLQWLDTLINSPAVQWAPGQKWAATDDLRSAREGLRHLLYGDAPENAPNGH